MDETLSRFSDMLSQYSEKIEILPSVEEAIEGALEGNLEFSLKGFLIGVLKILLSVMEENALPIMSMLVIAFACAICMTAADCDQPPWSDSLLMAMGITLAIPAATALKTVIESAYSFFADMEAVNISVIPALATVAVPVKTGVFLTAAQIFIQLMKNVFLPAAIIYGVLSLCSVTGNRFSLGKISGMVKSLYNWGLGIVMMVFSAVTAGAGVASGMSLSLAVKTVQYTAGNAVPVVGQYLSESAEVVASGAALIKSAAGIGATVAIASVCITPFLKMFGLMLLFKIAAILVRPVLDARLCAVVEGTGEAVSMMMGAVALMSVFSFLNVAVIAGAGVNSL